MALLFSIFMLVMVAYIYDKLPPAFFELITIFTSDPSLQFQWLFFDNFMSKLITLFVAPMLIFDAISGDRASERFGIMLARPITRTQYLLMKLFSASLVFGIVFLPIVALGYPVFMSIVHTLTLEGYFGTAVLVYLLAFFTMSVGILVSTLTKKAVVSFIAMFGVMAVFMMPNATKYTSDALNSLSMATPHYYATYFSSHAFDAATFAVYAVVVVLFSIPFIVATIWRFGKEDL